MIGKDVMESTTWEEERPTKEELETILREHEEWVRSHTEEGRKADLSGAYLWEADLSGAVLWDADLSGANLRDADLSGAILRSANLWTADLTNANLAESNLRDAVLWGATLTDADFREANLRNADLGGTTGLQVQSIARANTSNATLPEDVARFEGLTAIAAATKSARKLFIALGLACAYAVLAISTQEAGGATLTLPFITTVEISVEGFFAVVPALLALGFGYFHLQMQRLWDELSGLPAVFPDGTPLDQKIHPWLITGLVRAHVPFLRDEPVRFFPLQKLVIIGLAWGTVPLTLAYFAVRFEQIFPGAPVGSGWIVALLSAVLAGAVLSYRAARDTLRERASAPVQLFKRRKDERRWPSGESVFWVIESVLVAFAYWLALQTWM